MPRLLLQCLSRSLTTALVAAGLIIAIGAGPAAADPSNAKGAGIGTADCGSAGMFTFVVNSGVGNGQGNTWDPALAVTETDTRAVFIPTELHLTFTSPFGTFPIDATKGNVQGTVECSVQAQAVNGPFSFEGTAIGNIVIRGHS